jgi:hypothetical protein
MYPRPDETEPLLKVAATAPPTPSIVKSVAWVKGRAQRGCCFFTCCECKFIKGKATGTMSSR